MGSNTLAARTNGQTIDETWFNIIRSILIADYVPRDSTGAPISKAGSIGTATYPFKRAYIDCGQWSIGDIKIHHSYNGLVPVDAGWFPCDGSVINETNYDAAFGTGSWAADIVSSSLDGKYSPNFTGKYPVGKTTTTQGGTIAITAVGNASNKTNATHFHQISASVPLGNDVVYDNAGQATTIARQALPGGTHLAMTIDNTAYSIISDLYTAVSGSAALDIQPASIEVIYYIKIV